VSLYESVMSFPDSVMYVQESALSLPDGVMSLTDSSVSLREFDVFSRVGDDT
jgi:hypothetical protein